MTRHNRRPSSFVLRLVGGMLLALVAAPGRADVKQVDLMVKGAT